MKELTRNELAIVKRTAKSTKQLRDKKARITAKIADLEKELADIEANIEIFENPIRHLTGGFTSEEVLNGTMEVEISKAEEQTEEENNNPFGESNECGTDTTKAPFEEN